jgi:hypothetical protein
MTLACDVLEHGRYGFSVHKPYAAFCSAGQNGDGAMRGVERVQYVAKGDVAHPS